jgi:copper chaperone CopZ
MISAGAIVVLVVVGLVVLSAGDKVESAVIKVEGMSCNNCADKIEGALSTLEGVKSVSVSLEDKAAKVNFVSSLTDVPSLEKEIAKLGYDAGSTKAETPHSDEAGHGAACEGGSGGLDCCGGKSTQPSA